MTDKGFDDEKSMKYKKKKQIPKFPKKQNLLSTLFILNVNKNPFNVL